MPQCETWCMFLKSSHCSIIDSFSYTQVAKIDSTVRRPLIYVRIPLLWAALLLVSLVDLTGLHRKSQNLPGRERYQSGKSMMRKFRDSLRNSQRRDSSILGLQLQTLMSLPIKAPHLLVPPSLPNTSMTRKATGVGRNCNELSIQYYYYSTQCLKSETVQEQLEVMEQLQRQFEACIWSQHQPVGVFNWLYLIQHLEVRCLLIPCAMQTMSAHLPAILLFPYYA